MSNAINRPYVGPYVGPYIGPGGVAVDAAYNAASSAGVPAKCTIPNQLDLLTDAIVQLDAELHELEKATTPLLDPTPQPEPDDWGTRTNSTGVAETNSVVYRIQHLNTALRVLANRITALRYRLAV